MPSVRAIAASCLDVHGTFSIRRDVYGYIWGGRMNRKLHLKEHLELIQDDALNICPFLVGHAPGFPADSEFDLAELQVVQTAIDVMRAHYAQVGVGVRRIYWRWIPPEDAGGYTVVDADESKELTRAFSGPNDGMDVFFVRTITDAAGWSRTPGPCNKDSASGRNGAVIEVGFKDESMGVVQNPDWIGLVMAHEVGHYLGLEHATTLENIMGEDPDGNGIGAIELGISVELTPGQGDKMKSHCLMRAHCGGSS